MPGFAWAANMAQGISAVLCLIYIVAKVPVLKPERSQRKLRGSDGRRQLAMGAEMAFQFAIAVSGSMVMQAAINLFGFEAVDAYTAAGKLQNLVTEGMAAKGADKGGLKRTEFRKREYEKNLNRCASGPVGGICVCHVGGHCQVCDSETVHRPVFCRKYGYFQPCCPGRKSLPIFAPLSLFFVVRFCFQKYHTGLRLWVPAHDGRFPCPLSQSSGVLEPFGLKIISCAMREQQSVC